MDSISPIGVSDQLNNELETFTTSRKREDLHRTLEYLLEEGFIREQDAKFSLTEKGKSYYDKKVKKIERRPH